MKKLYGVLVIAALIGAAFAWQHLAGVCGYIEGTPGLSRSIVICDVAFVWG